MLCFCSCSWATNLWYSIFALPGTTPRLPLRCNGARLFFGGSSVVSFRGLLRLSAVCDLDARLGWNFFLLVTACGWLWLGTSASRCCGCRPRARTMQHCADLSPDLVHNCAAAQLPPAFPEATPRPFSDAFQSMCAVAFVTDLGAIATGGPATAPHRKIELRHGPLTCGAGPIAFCFFGVCACRADPSVSMAGSPR